jgi:DNA-binding transcriptional LysR family regulator
MQNMHEFLSGTSFEELVAFTAVAESLSFSKASHLIGRDPTILSRRVSQLERRLGVTLLSRTTRQVALTEIGTIYYSRVRTLLEELHDANLEASHFASSPQGLLRISLSITFGRQWITPHLASFLAKYPQITVDARFTDRVVDLVAEGFDVAIRVGTLPSSSLTARKIASFKYKLVASPHFVQNYGAPKTAVELSNFPCLGLTSFSSWPEWNLQLGERRESIKPEGPLVSDNSEVIMQAAINGAGIALAADWLTGPAISEGTLVAILPDWEAVEQGGIYAVMPPGRLIPQKTRLFVDEMTSAIRSGWSES